MHDSFERKVQEKMEELNLVPSAPVWEKIELEIKPERKRRGVILWMFCGLLLIGGGLLSYELFKPSEIAKTQPNIPPTTSHSKRTNSNPDSPTSSASTIGKENTSTSTQSGIATQKNTNNKRGRDSH